MALKPENESQGQSKTSIRSWDLEVQFQLNAPDYVDLDGVNCLWF